VSYARVLVGRDIVVPDWATLEQDRLSSMIQECAAVFAEGCRRSPDRRFPQDPGRLPLVRYGRGLGVDEATGFLRALEAGLVTVEADGHFLIPRARACSRNLHLVGRNDDHVALHTEVLIHVTAYAEMVLDHGWQPERMVFDPFARGAALDLWGYQAPAAEHESWWEGDITFVAEAKARVTGSDSLTGLAAALERLKADPTASVDRGHRRKWDELAKIVSDHGPVDLLLVADGARWWYRAHAVDGGAQVSRIQ
jgi:hypothetical protein